MQDIQKRDFLSAFQKKVPIALEIIVRKAA